MWDFLRDELRTPWHYLFIRRYKFRGKVEVEKAIVTKKKIATKLSERYDELYEEFDERPFHLATIILIDLKKIVAEAGVF